MKWKKEISERTSGRPFPPKGRKSRLKYSAWSLGGRSNRRIWKKNLRNSQKFPNSDRTRALREKRNLKAPYHWIPFPWTSHTRGTMRSARQWNRAITSRSNCAIRKSARWLAWHGEVWTHRWRLLWKEPLKTCCANCERKSFLDSGIPQAWLYFLELITTDRDMFIEMTIA